MKPSAEETSVSGNVFARRQEIATSHLTPMSCILPTRNIVSRLALMKRHIDLATLGRVEARGGGAALGHIRRAESEGKTNGSGPLAETEESHDEYSIRLRS